MYEILMHKILRDETWDTVPRTKIFVGCKKKKKKKKQSYYVLTTTKRSKTILSIPDMLKNKRANIRRCVYMVFYLSENYVFCQMYEDLQRD